MVGFAECWTAEHSFLGTLGSDAMVVFECEGGRRKEGRVFMGCRVKVH